MSNLSLSLSSISLPNISEEDLANQQSIRQILEYLMVLDKSLKFYLSHIDADNLTDEFRQEITDATEGMTQLVQTMTNLEAGLSSTRKQTAEGFEQMVTKDTFNSFAKQTAEGFEQTVSKGNIISSINQSAEEILIQANKIKLEGAVTLNDNVVINTNGTLTAKNVNISGTVNATNGGLGSLALGNYGSISTGTAGFHFHSANNQFDFSGTIRANDVTTGNLSAENLYVTSSTTTRDLTVTGSFSLSSTALSSLKSLLGLS